MALKAGGRLGHYEILSSLGAGGMGEVYRAKDTKLGREVAIKLLLEEVASDPERLARFDREARVLASLNHSNIATLYGFETEGDTSFLVMELVEGETLADRIRRGAIPVDEALPLFLQIAEGLEAAHEKGVIHRDLKPANIKVTEDGQVKILDFGLAKAMAVDTGESDAASISMSPTLTLAATQRGEILGTAGYMSPEQARGQAVDRRADIWAFGVCLYEALTGRRMFEGETAADTLAKVLEREVDWNALVDSTPRSVRRLLQRCLAKRAENRLQHIGDARLELREALAAPEGDEPRPGGVVTEKRSPAPLVLAALAVGVVVAGIAVWTLKPAPAPLQRPVVRSVLSAAPSGPVRFTTLGRDLAITPDGRVVVYQSEGSLYVRRVDRLVGSQLAGTEGATTPFVSPDGAWVGFVDGSTLKKVSILGGPPVTLSDLPSLPTGASWGADDTIILGFLDEGLYRVSGGGGELELLVALDRERGETAYRFPELLPGGEAVLFTVFTSANAEQAKIVAVFLATGERQDLVSGGTGARYVPTGHLVYGLSGTLRAVAFDVESLEVRGTPVPVLQGVGTKALGAVNFGFSQEGSLVYVTAGAGGGTQATLVWVQRDGAEENLSVPLQFYAYPRISPDGQRVAVSSGDDMDVMIWDLGRETLDRLTRDPGLETYSIWTPDSREVVFGSGRGGTFDLYQMAADGTGEVKQLTETTESLYPSSISPDGKLLVYRVGATAFDLGLLSLEGEGAPEPLLDSEFGERNGEISPDGRWLAYQSDESGEDRIYVKPFPDVDRGRHLISAGGGSEPLWSPDGTELFYRSGDRLMAVPVRTEPAFEAGSPEVLFTGSYAFQIGRDYDISPDGQRFLMIKLAETTEGRERSHVVLVQNWFEELKRLVPVD